MDRLEEHIAVMNQGLRSVIKRVDEEGSLGERGAGREEEIEMVRAMRGVSGGVSGCADWVGG